MWNILRIVLALSGTGVTGMLGIGAIVLTLDRIFKVSYGRGCSHPRRRPHGPPRTRRRTAHRRCCPSPAPAEWARWSGG